ncbi:MAG: hypothetical protein ACK40G_13045 [Cytophagaceae bacterium]
MKDLKKIGKRLQQFMEKNRIGVNEMGRLTGTSGAQISNIINGRKYGVDKMLNILDRFPQLNFYWLVTGDGDMEFVGGSNKTHRNELSLKEVDALQQNLVELQNELSRLKVVNEKLSNAVEYQDLTIEAYKKTIEVQTASINDLKEMMNAFREKSGKEENSRVA